MHVLFLTQIVPYPPDAGPKVKTWQVLKYLAGLGHRITLATFVRPEEDQHLSAVQAVCTQVHPVPLHRSRLADVRYWLRSQLTGRPFLVERDDVKAMHSFVYRQVVSAGVDVIHADQLSMAQFAWPYTAKANQVNGKDSIDRPGFGRRPMTVFDAHNATWIVVQRMRQYASWYLKPIAHLEADRIRRFEGMTVRDFDQTFAVTEPDRQALLQAAAVTESGVYSDSNQITVVPIAVDVQQMQPIQREPGSQNIITLGTLHYPPNADGIRWFAHQVFPLILRQQPQATLTIVGKNPPNDFLQLQTKYPGVIRVTGYVVNTKPYLEESALMVVPVRAGGGIRVRILEAFAQGMPVVTTTLGLEGIEAQTGEDVLVADDPQEFAGAVVSLLRDGERQSRLAERGRLLVEQCYDWRAVMKLMDPVYQSMHAHPGWGNPKK